MPKKEVSSQNIIAKLNPKSRNCTQGSQPGTKGPHGRRIVFPRQKIEPGMGEEVYQNRHDRGYGILQARRQQGKVRDMPRGDSFLREGSRGRVVTPGRLDVHGASLEGPQGFSPPHFSSPSRCFVNVGVARPVDVARRLLSAKAPT